MYSTDMIEGYQRNVWNDIFLPLNKTEDVLTSSIMFIYLISGL